MKQLPENAVAYKKTEIFTQDTIPTRLLNQHNTKAGTWAKINVISGKLNYQILTSEVENYILTPEEPGIVEPEIPHQVKPLDQVEFFVEFYQIFPDHS